MSNTAAKVTIYGAEWCPPCHATKAYLKSRNVAYNYVNIDEQPDEGRAIAEKTGWTAIPIIQVADEFILGFDRQKIDGALSASKLL